MTLPTSTTARRGASSRSLLFLVAALLLVAAVVVPTVAAQDATKLEDFADSYYDEEFDDHDEMWLLGRYLQSTGTTTTTTTERVNIWSRLKESLGMTIIGFILIICAPCLIWKNEGRHVRELFRIDFAKNKAVVVDCNNAGDDTLEQLVYFAGSIEVGNDTFLDFGSGGENKGQLDLLEPLPNCFILKRTCYIYQKFEDAQQTVQQDTIGGGQTRQTTYTLREDWTTTPQPAQLEHLPQHTNSRGIWDQLVDAAVTSQEGGSSGGLPPGVPEDMAAKLGLTDPNAKPHGLIVAPSAHVGAFGLSRKIVMENYHELGRDTMIPVPVENLPMTVEGCDGLLKGSDNVLRNFPQGAQPFNGACKVVFEYVKDGFDCSFVVQQTFKQPSTEEQPDVEAAKFGVNRAPVVNNNCCGKGCGDDDYGDIWMVRKGQHSLEEMIDMAKQDESKVVMIIRVVGWVALCAGWCMLFAPFTTAFSTLPILGTLGNFAVFLAGLILSCTCCCTVLTVAYIRYRPLLAFLLLALSLGIWGLIAWRMNDAVEEGGETTTT